VLPRWGRLAVDALATGISLAFMATFAWMMLERVARARAAGMTTVDLHVPIWPFYGAAWLGLALAVVLLPVYLHRIFQR
jgi:TRAP-type C4-dicarboxylate transport system permease small subunit